ncbi:RNA recognition motif. (a.k.a. RRM, RBD, or RNP domain), putative [Leishmania lindenbergi]|uniref:RNA recognition motif (RRM, RBD, or RNP domain) n=1 Tax=Leishmania lindenbergi TaxID=651832 RepID=A0AAW3AD04_9TRYP
MSLTQSRSPSSSPAQRSNPESVVAAVAGDNSTFGGCAFDPDALRNLIVNYLPPLMNEEQVCELFGQFGRIESVKIIYDKITGESRGYGFVKYRFYFSATYAVSCLNRFEIGGKKLKVAYANVQAAKEAYDLLRRSTMELNVQQQQAMLSMYYNQMMLTQEQTASAAAAMTSSGPMGGGADYDPYMNIMDSNYAMRQRGGTAYYGQGMYPGMAPGRGVYPAGTSTSVRQSVTPSMVPLGF